MKFGVGSSQLKHLLLDDRIEFAAEAGFDFLQWSSWEVGDDISELERLGKKAKEMGVPFLAMHLPYLPTPSLGSNYVKSHIEAAKKVGAKYIVVHPVAFGEFIKFFETVSSLCRAVDLTLLIENPSCKEKHFGIGIPTVFSPLQFLKLVRLSGASVCFDCNHSIRVGLDPIDFYAMVSKFTKMIHISDASSNQSVSHAPIGKGEIDFKKFFKLIRSSKFDGPVVLELKNRYHNSLKSQLKQIKLELMG